MQKIYKHRIRVILGLSVVAVILLGGILVNQFVASSVHIPTQSAVNILPTIEKERYFGSSDNDTFVDAFFIGEDRFVFYNGTKGVMQKNEGESICYEGKILAVALTSYGFVTAIETDGNLALQCIDFDGVPTASFPVQLEGAQIQALSFDGDICVAIKYKSDYDYALSYFKFDHALTLLYRRDIYSLYNLSLVSVYPLSNATIIFFSATYGSVKRGGYTFLHNTSLAMTTEYFSSVTDYEVTDAKPYKDGYLVGVLEKGVPKLLYLDESFEETLIPVCDNECEGLTIYTNSRACYIGIERDSYVDLYALDTDTLTLNENFATTIYDCIFIDGVAVFAIEKARATYIYHKDFGILSPILTAPPSTLTLKFNKRICFFATLPPSFDSSFSDSEVYFATLL